MQPNGRLRVICSVYPRKHPVMKKILIPLLACIIAMGLVTAGAAEPESAEDYLEFYEVPNNRCLSLMRGNMRMMRNMHPEKNIEYRMIRELAGVRQASLIRDRIAPGEEGQALGCAKLDGMEQIWIIVQARFVDNL